MVKIAAYTARDMGLVPGQEAKVLHAVQSGPSQNKILTFFSFIKYF